MSAVCMCCNDDIAPPNEFWADLTYFSPTPELAIVSDFPEVHARFFVENLEFIRI